jgi:hypothetical protein
LSPRRCSAAARTGSGVRGLKLSERILRVIERNYREARDFLKENAKKSLFGNVPIKNLMPFARGVLIPNFQEPKRVFSATFQPKLRIWMCLCQKEVLYGLIEILAFH